MTAMVQAVRTWRLPKPPILVRNLARIHGGIGKKRLTRPSTLSSQDSYARFKKNK